MAPPSVSKVLVNRNDTPSHSSPLTPPVILERGIPDGGLEAWCAVLGSFIAQFCGFGYASAFGVYQEYYTREFLSHESSSAISWIGSLSAFLVTAIGPICGPLHDRGHFYLVFVGGALLQSFSLFMLSLAQPGSYYQVFLTQGIGSGIAQGLMYVPSFAILSQHFCRRRALVMSIVASGASLGGIVHTIMLNRLINGPIGFATGVRISAGLVTGLLFISCLLIRTRYETGHVSLPANTWKAAIKCVTEVPSLLMVTAFLFFQTAYLYPFFYFQLDSVRHGLSTSFSFYSLVIVNAASFCGRFSAGFIAHFISVVDLTILSTVACAVLLGGMIWLSSMESFIALGLLYGLLSGMNIAMMAPFMALITTDPSELGVRMGISFAITGKWSPISGALLTKQYIWWAPALFCAVSCNIRYVIRHTRPTR
ncbi:MFS general substrate transporter [Pisolithus croceorrhizus]|nr:MFS general substrate transporter [Pisolithus croceorrhizus]